MSVDKFDPEENTKILESYSHPRNGAVRIEYEMDFKELGKKKGDVTFWPNVDYDTIWRELRSTYRGELESRRGEPEPKKDYDAMRGKTVKEFKAKK